MTVCLFVISHVIAICFVYYTACYSNAYMFVCYITCYSYMLVCYTACLFCLQSVLGMTICFVNRFLKSKLILFTACYSYDLGWLDWRSRWTPEIRVWGVWAWTRWLHARREPGQNGEEPHNHWTQRHQCKFLRHHQIYTLMNALICYFEFIIYM